MQSNIIILLVGESGSGKTTIANQLAQYGLTQVRSYTTRPPRSPDEDSHTSITDDEFKTLQHLVAYTYFNGHRYGATQEQIDNNDIYVVDPAGINYFRQSYTGNKTPVVVYLRVSESERLQRMINRGDSLEATSERIIHDREAFADVEDMADFVIDNDNAMYATHMLLDIFNWTASATKEEKENTIEKD